MFLPLLICIANALGETAERDHRRRRRETSDERTSHFTRGINEGLLRYHIVLHNGHSPQDNGRKLTFQLLKRRKTPNVSQARF